MSRSLLRVNYEHSSKFKKAPQKIGSQIGPKVR